MKPTNSVGFNGVEYPLYEITHLFSDERITLGTFSLLKQYENRESLSEELREKIERIDEILYGYMPDHLFDEDEKRVEEYLVLYYDGETF